jgi:hypothetical protein
VVPAENVPFVMRLTGPPDVLELVLLVLELLLAAVLELLLAAVLELLLAVVLELLLAVVLELLLAVVLELLAVVLELLLVVELLDALVLELEVVLDGTQPAAFPAEAQTSDPQSMGGPYPDPDALQVKTALLWQRLAPLVHTSVWQVCAVQCWVALQSVSALQSTHTPSAVSQSFPAGVQALSLWHAVRHWSPKQAWPMEQSALVAQSTHTPLWQTVDAEQSWELTHDLYMVHTPSAQCRFVPQSVSLAHCAQT